MNADDFAKHTKRLVDVGAESSAAAAAPHRSISGSWRRRWEDKNKGGGSYGESQGIPH